MKPVNKNTSNKKYDSTTFFKTSKSVYRFSELLSQYAENIPTRISTIATITSMKNKFKWNKIKQDTFKELKRLVAHGVLLAYPDFYE